MAPGEAGVSTRRRYPALEAWHEELSRGERSAMTLDALWAAACHEANAQEFAAIPKLHDAFIADAREIIEQALREEKRNG